MRRLEVATVCAALVVALAATGFVPVSAAKPQAAASAFMTRENLRQSLALRPRGPESGVQVREARRMRAILRVPLPDLDPATVTGNSHIGLRIGDWTFERPVSFDPAWKPGVTHASIRVPSSDPARRGATTVRANWGGGVLRISVVSSAEAPLAAANSDAVTGPVSSPIDAAARLGAQHVHLGGNATGAMARKVVPILDGSASLAHLSVIGRADVTADSIDSRPPVIAITKPAAVSTRATGTLDVEGTVRDDRSITSLAWSIDGGAETLVPLVVDPSSGFLDDVRAAFTFSLPATDGVHLVRVLARDAAGNTASARIAFLVPVSGSLVLRSSKWGTQCVDAQGRVQAWGYGTTSPTVAPGIAGVLASAGNLALLDDGTATTLAGNPYGASSSNAPFPIPGVADIVDVAHSSTSTASYALRADGTVWAWGDNSRGQLGDGTMTSRFPPVQVPGLPEIKAIAAGAYHALALDREGGVWTWGSFAASTDPAARSPRQVAGIANAAVISASQFDRYPTGAAVLADGTLWMWGDATSGQLGGSATARETPAFQVPGIAGARSIAMGYNHALVLLGDGAVLARGGPTSQVSGYWGELGDGTLTPHYEFQPVPGLEGVVELAAGAHTSHALLGDGTIRAWGQNTYGSLGDGTTKDAPSPVVVLLAQ